MLLRTWLWIEEFLLISEQVSLPPDWLYLCLLNGFICIPLRMHEIMRSLRVLCTIHWVFVNTHTIHWMSVNTYTHHSAWIHQWHWYMTLRVNFISSSQDAVFLFLHGQFRPIRVLLSSQVMKENIQCCNSGFNDLKALIADASLCIFNDLLQSVIDVSVSSGTVCG